MPLHRENAELRQIVLRDPSAGCWLRFSAPLDVLVARTPAEVPAVLREACARVRGEGLHAAGFLSYEAAPGFDPSCVTRPAGDFPPACFGLFRAPERIPGLDAPVDGQSTTAAWQPDIDRERYRRSIADIREQIARGNTYQVNYTVRLIASGPVDAWRLFTSIAADAPCGAFVDARDFAIASASPELFFELSGRRLTCRPMKGTAARGMTTAEDDRIRAALKRSVKDRAENVMIADMVRNDAGRIARPGTVCAASLFDVEKYRTVWQMTSTITAETDAAVPEIFRALFPPASITGAPKVAAMRLIAGLEDGPRGIYTGCIGFIAPDGQARFNVAIRTAVVDRRDGSAVYGVGGGIVWDSDADAEYQECLDKASVLDARGAARDFGLLETLRWTRDGGWTLLEEHLTRLADSARYFDFRCDRDEVARSLEAFAGGLRTSAARIRLCLDADGRIAIEAAALPPDGSPEPAVLRLADGPVDPGDPFLYHKTTCRAVYERALAAAGPCDDVLLWNTRGELTESTIANVVVRIDGALYTPPVTCGLLPGTLRRSLLDAGQIAERVMGVDELARVEALYLINSLRGWRPAVIAGRSRAAR